MKSIIKIMIFLLIIGLSSTGSIEVYGSSKVDLLNEVQVENVEKTVDGKVVIRGTSNIEKLKIKVTYNESVTYQDVYIVNGSFEETLWLLNDIGTYEIKVLVNSQGNSYICDSKFNVYNRLSKNEINVEGMYLNPEKDIASDNTEITKLAESITVNSTTDKDKAKALYNWVSTNIKYDYEKFSFQQNPLYNLEYGSLVALSYKKGVCYDMSALYAALARSISLETKLVKGQGITPQYNGYHAWNEIYSREEKRWIKVDVAFASTSDISFFDSNNFDTTHFKYEEM